MSMKGRSPWPALWAMLVGFFMTLMCFLVSSHFAPGLGWIAVNE
jgi:hypothetical protein